MGEMGFSVPAAVTGIRSGIRGVDDGEQSPWSVHHQPGSKPAVKLAARGGASANDPGEATFLIDQLLNSKYHKHERTSGSRNDYL
jgi:hypothetical protein